jgi:hypothetical protein
MLVKDQTYRGPFKSFGAWMLITCTGPLSGTGNLDILSVLRVLDEFWRSDPGRGGPLLSRGCGPLSPLLKGLCEHNEYNLKLVSAILNATRLTSLIVRTNTHSYKYKICFTNSFFTFGSKAISLPFNAFELFKPLFTVPFKCHWKVSLGIEYFSQTSLNLLFHLLCYSVAICITLGPPGDDFTHAPQMFLLNYMSYTNRTITI